MQFSEIELSVPVHTQRADSYHCFGFDVIVINTPNRLI